MKLNYITMLVRDIEKSIDFYQRAVEMHVVRRFHPEIGRIVFMSDAEESITLEFIQPEKNIETVETKGIVMSYSAKGRLEEKHGQLAEDGSLPFGYQRYSPKTETFYRRGSGWHAY